MGAARLGRPGRASTGARRGSFSGIRAARKLIDSILGEKKSLVLLEEFLRAEFEADPPSFLLKYGPVLPREVEAAPAGHQTLQLVMSVTEQPPSKMIEAEIQEPSSAEADDNEDKS